MVNDYKIIGIPDLISYKIHGNNESLVIPVRKSKVLPSYFTLM